MTRNTNAFILSLVCVSAAALTALHAHPSGSLQTSGAQAQQQSQSAEEQQQSLLAQRALNSSSSSPAAPSLSPATTNLLNGIQAQAQRQISQLNGLMLSGVNQLAPLAAHAVNLTNSNKYGNVLEVLSNVGRAIHQQIVNGGNSANNQIQIVTAPNSAGKELSAGNNKKNEYQSIVVGENQQLSFGNKQLAPQSVGAGAGNGVAGVNLASGGNNGQLNSTNYREQSEQLRQEIVRRAGQLQQVVASSMEVLKNNGDLIVRRLLEQLNGRLDQAKAKADKIINEPAMNEVAIRGLTTINQGLNNLNNIITNIVSRLDISGKDVNANLAAVGASGGSTSPPSSGEPQQRGAPNSPSDSSRFKLNFHQLGQQFSSAIQAVQQQQRQMQLQQRQQQQQQQQQSAANNNLKLAQ